MYQGKYWRNYSLASRNDGRRSQACKYVLRSTILFPNTACMIPRLILGGGCWELPLPFFSRLSKNGGTAAAVFDTPYHTSFPHILCKFQTQVMQGQVTRSRQVTSPHKKFECLSKLRRLNDRLETFRKCYKQQYLWNVHLRILISVT